MAKESIQIPSIYLEKFLNFIELNDEKELRRYPTSVLGDFIIDLINKTGEANAQLLRKDRSQNDIENEVLKEWNALMRAYNEYNAAADDSDLLSATRKLGKHFAALMWHCSSPRQDFVPYFEFLLKQDAIAAKADSRRAVFSAERQAGVLGAFDEIDPRLAEVFRSQL